MTRPVDQQPGIPVPGFVLLELALSPHAYVRLGSQRRSIRLREGSGRCTQARALEVRGSGRVAGPPECTGRMRGFLLDMVPAGVWAAAHDSQKERGWPGRVEVVVVVATDSRTDQSQWTAPELIEKLRAPAWIDAVVQTRRVANKFTASQRLLRYVTCTSAPTLRSWVVMRIEALPVQMMCHRCTCA